uniref:AB hydrolase-1 domain-containing protein n=2 Tax=Vitrella brassicaformis TaxID=1169539 RepID=A0A7S1P5Z3_9ALVE|mmetsp:Transcript_34580/g.85727  ORF Transcript_34580/g.85727 Transcript_34580/m.85727 type:complete len:665 (+) Transcript_34580:92-2086(+)
MCHVCERLRAFDEAEANRRTTRFGSLNLWNLWKHLLPSLKLLLPVLALGCAAGGLVAALFIPGSTLMLVGVYLALDVRAYLRFRQRRRDLQEMEHYRSPHLDEHFRPYLEKQLLDQPPEDLYSFLFYAFFGQAPETISVQQLVDWFDCHTPRDVKHTKDIIPAVEAKLGFKFPDHVREIPDITPHNYCPRTHGFRYGETRMEAFYRPLVLVLAVRLVSLTCRLVLQAVGWRLRSPRGDYMMEYFVYDPRSAADKAAGKTMDPPPVLLVHGFGLGVIYYFPLLMSLWFQSSPLCQWISWGIFFKKREAPSPLRPMVFVEMQWIGLYPHGDFDLARCPTMMQSVEEMVAFLEHEKLVSSEAVIRMETAWAQRHGKGAQVQIDTQVDVFCQSYGTGVVSLLHRRFPGLIRRALLFDPICFIPQLTKKAQLTQLTPLQVHSEVPLPATILPARSLPCIHPIKRRLLDQDAMSTDASCGYDSDTSPYHLSATSSPQSTHLQPPDPAGLRQRANRRHTIASEHNASTPNLCGLVADGFNAEMGISRRCQRRASKRLRAMGEKANTLFRERFQLWMMWLVAYKEFGTIWTAGRQLQGCEYIDRGDLFRLKDNLMVVLAGADGLLASQAIQGFIKSNEEAVQLLVVPDASHAFSLYFEEGLEATLRFLTHEN